MAHIRVLHYCFDLLFYFERIFDLLFNWSMQIPVTIPMHQLWAA